MELHNKIVVITGAGSGIGRALAVRFHAEGAKQIVCADINLDNAQETADMIGGVAMLADVAKEEDTARIIEDTEADIGPIDLFCSMPALVLARVSILPMPNGSRYGISMLCPMCMPRAIWCRAWLPVGEAIF